MDTVPKTPSELKALYPYQFTKSDDRLAFTRGWFGLFAATCRRVDETLGNDKRGFQWLQLKEKFGSARWYWQMDKSAGTADPEMKQRLLDMIQGEVTKTETTCIVCGDVGERNSYGGYHLVLCPTHSKLRRVDPGLTGIIWLDDNTPGV